MKLRHDAASRAIAGASSGGICAFTVAWERPNEFSKVVSWIGSFTNIASGKTVREGGHNYEAMIRKTPKKPIRVFLQDGANDLDNANGNWPLANQTLAKSLAYASYDYRFEYGNGFHSHRHGRAICPTRCGGCGGITRGAGAGQSVATGLDRHCRESGGRDRFSGNGFAERLPSASTL